MIKIDNWMPLPDDGDVYVYTEGNNVKTNLQKFFPKSFDAMNEMMTQEEKTSLETFIVDKKVFFKTIERVGFYIDYFINFYDPDKELPTIYLKFKNIIDTSTDDISLEYFSKILMREIFRDSRIKVNVMKLVEDNYTLDVTKDDKTNREFTDDKDFTNNDIKQFLVVSMIIKLIIPIAAHFITVNKRYNKDQKNDFLLDLYISIFYKISESNGDNSDDLIMKLYEFTMDKLSKHKKAHPVLWEQQEALRGLTIHKVCDNMMEKHIILDNFFKFNFTDNIVAFLKVIIETQLKFTYENDKYAKTPVKVDSNKGPDGLSGKDKLEQNMAKIDEGIIIKSEVALEDMLPKLEKMVGPISQDEIDFYMAHVVANNPIHSSLLYNYFAKYFRGFTELFNSPNEVYIRLLIILKRMLEKKGYKQFQHFLSSKLEGKVNNRKIQNSKFLSKFKNSEIYINLMDDAYTALKNFKDEIFIDISSYILNNKFSYVEYDDPDSLGQIIDMNEDIICYELLTFIDEI